MKDLSKFLWKGLNLERYSVEKILPQNRSHAIIIMRNKDMADDYWCLEYCGSGHYFDTAEELTAYYHNRGFKPEDYTPNA